MECISFISDLNASVSPSTEYLNTLARILLPFFQTEEGTIAARVLLESKPESRTCPSHIEAFFSSLVLQLCSLPQHISGSISLADAAADSECALVDTYGFRVASLAFKSKPAPSYDHRFSHLGYFYTISLEVQVGSEKPSTYVIHNSIASLPSSLKVSLSLEQHGVFVFVDSVPICIINATSAMIAFSKFVCSIPINFNVQRDKASSSTAPIPQWLRLFFRSKLHQQALDSSPVSGHSVSTILKCTERISVLLDKMAASNRSAGWSSSLHHTLLAELVSKRLFR